MKLTQANGWYLVETANREEGSVAKAAGFWWSGSEGKYCKVPWRWCSKEVAVAGKLAAEHAVEPLRSEILKAAGLYQESLDASRATDAEIDVPAPAGLSYLPFQRGGIAFAAKRQATLIADEMGLGKTIQTIGLINLDPSIQNVLVICPASLKLNWRNEANKWLVRDHGFVYVVSGNEPVPAGSRFVIVNYESLRKGKHPELMAREWDLLVCDESHRLKSEKAQQTQAVCGAPPVVEKSDRTGEWVVTSPRVPGLIDKAKRKLFLTGTPILNKPVELWTTLQALDPQNWKNYMYFAKKYCAAPRNAYGWDFSGAAHLAELQEKLRTTIMVRRLKKDVLKELPPKYRQVVVLPTNGSQDAVDNERKAWEDLEGRLNQLEAES